MTEEELQAQAPPRRARGLVWRALLAGVLISLMTAGAVSATVLLQVDDILNVVREQGRAPIVIPEIDRAGAGKAQTLMLLGSDRRTGDRKLGLKPRSDTVILVRLDPDQSAIAMMSIPRDLIGVPGMGPLEKINGAYETGGERGMLRTVKRLLSVDGHPFAINHVVTLDFGGFRRAINYIGCVYADVDRRYFNAQGGPGGYATINIMPGYQKICGSNALDYVRYRHTDNDLVRSARQQDFLRQVRNSAGARKLMSFNPGNLRRLARVFARYFSYDAGLRNKKTLFGFAKTVLFTAQHPVREVRFRVSPAPDNVNLVASKRQIRRSVSEFLAVKASAEPRTPGTEKATGARKPSGRKRSRVKGLVGARGPGENLAIVGARKVDFPFYFPRLLTRTGVYAANMPRIYKIKDERGRKHDAYRLVVSRQMIGEFYGVQGMSWRYPPILDDPHETITRGGRKLMVFRDGNRIRLVAWRTPKGAYWVANTLTHSLSSAQMLGIAESLRRFGR